MKNSSKIKIVLVVAFFISAIVFVYRSTSSFAINKAFEKADDFYIMNNQNLRCIGKNWNNTHLILLKKEQILIFSQFQIDLPNTTLQYLYDEKGHTHYVNFSGEGLNETRPVCFGTKEQCEEFILLLNILRKELQE